MDRKIFSLLKEILLILSNFIPHGLLTSYYLRLPPCVQGSVVYIFLPGVVESTTPYMDLIQTKNHGRKIKFDNKR